MLLSSFNASIFPNNFQKKNNLKLHKKLHNKYLTFKMEILQMQESECTERLTKRKKTDMKIEHYNDVGQLKLYLE